MGLDLGRFWRENEEAKAKPFRTDKPRPAIEISVDDHWLLDELSVSSTIRYYRDPEYRAECNREANRRCREALGIAPFAETFPAHEPKRIEQVLGAEWEIVEGGTPWLMPTLDTTEKIAAKLDDLEDAPDDTLRERFEIGPAMAQTGQTTSGWSRGPATVATSVLGTEEAVMLCVDEPDLMERFFCVLADLLVRMHRLRASTEGKEVRGVGILDDNCALFSPGLYRRFCFPVWQTLARELAPDPGDMRYQHSDSGMEHLLPILAELELTGANFGPTLLASTIRAAMPRTVIHGQLAPFTLRDGSIDQVRAETLRDWEAVGADGGWVATTAGSIPAGTKLESIRAWMEIVDGLRYGG